MTKILECMKEYFIGHYSPRGYRFCFAYSINNEILRWLDPKPITGQERDPQSVDFRGYLHDIR
jgi:hypothetical protein